MIIIYNEKIKLIDIINLSKYRINNINKKNYYYIWNNKIKRLKKYYKDYYINDNYDFNYFYEISKISLNIAKNINFNNLSYGITYNRFYDINNIYDLYNKNKYHMGAIINSIVEYIKYSFFYFDSEEDIFLIDMLDLTNDDYMFLVARLIFPTYYFDIFNEKDINSKYKMIISKIDSYNKYIKSIFIEIKKRHINMPFMDLIINQL